MLKAAFQNGVETALKRFGVREGSLAQALIGMGTTAAGQAALKVMAPNLMPTVSRAFEVPFQHLKNMGQGAIRAMRGPSSPADVLVRGLTGTPAAGGLRPMPGIIERMPR